MRNRLHQFVRDLHTVWCRINAISEMIGALREAQTEIDKLFAALPEDTKKEYGPSWAWTSGEIHNALTRADAHLPGPPEMVGPTEDQ